MISEAIVISAPIDRVYQAFADLAHWKTVLPDVADVQIIYDDAQHQEFLMTVSRPGGLETVRGIRFCEKDERIEMFQPVPPPGFTKMVGEWTFEDLGHATRVSATRRFNAGGQSQEAVGRKLRQYLHTNLQHFKRSLEQ